MSITVSVIIPAYNAEKYIAETIESVLAQTFPDLELLIINDGSTDRTIEITSDYSRQDKRLKLISQQNQGVSIARNRGIEMAKGEYLAFLDSDDKWLPNKLAAHVEHFNNNPHLGLSFGRVEFISFEGESTNYFSNSRLYELKPEHLYYENLVVTPSNAVIRRSVFENTDGFDPNLYGTEDMELFFRIIYRGWKVEGINDVLVNYRTNQAGISSNLYRMEENWEKLNHKIQTYAPEFIDRHRQQGDAFFLRYLARRTLRNRDCPQIGVAFINRALKSDWKIILKEPRRTILTAMAVYFRYSFANLNSIEKKNFVDLYMKINFINKTDPYYQIFNFQGYIEILFYKAILRPFLSISLKLGLKNQKKCIKIHLKDYKFPIYFRHNTSDQTVLYDVFIKEQYSCVADLKEPKLILDCGANVGYTSIYLLKKYPNAHVIAIEPDLDNFKICQKNLSCYGERVSLVHSGVWSHPTGLVVEREAVGKNEEWGIQVKEAKADQKPDIYATDIFTLLKESNFDRIDLLKLDVEGSESEIFAHNYEPWLSKVTNIAIELHGKQCEQTFFQALSKYNYQRSQSGELTICREIARKN